MLQIRVEGDPAESRALLDRLRAAGVEVQTGTVKARAEGFFHTYAMARIPDYPANGTTGSAAHGAAGGAQAAPVRVVAVRGRALPAGRRSGRHA